MSTNASEITLLFCLDHAATDLNESHPGFTFNWYPTYSASKCMYDGCSEKAFNTFIGIKIPDTIGTIPAATNNALKEVIDEAKKILKGGEALEKLTSYLFLKIRVFSYETGDFVAFSLLKYYAKLILRILKIDETTELSDKDINRILKKLNLLPAD